MGTKKDEAKQSTLMYFLLFCSAFQRILVVQADNKLLLPAASFPGSMPDSLSLQTAQLFSCNSSLTPKL